MSKAFLASLEIIDWSRFATLRFLAAMPVASMEEGVAWVERLHLTTEQTLAPEESVFLRLRSADAVDGEAFFLIEGGKVVEERRADTLVRTKKKGRGR